MDQEGRRSEQLCRAARLEGIGEGGGTAGAITGTNARLPGSQGEQFPVIRVEEDDVAALGIHPRQRIVQTPFRDLLKLRVHRENDVIPRHGLADHSSRRIVAPTRTILEEHRLSRGAGENRVQRELESRGATLPLCRKSANDGSAQELRRVKSLIVLAQMNAADSS